MNNAMKLRDGKLLAIVLLSFIMISMLQVSPQLVTNSTNSGNTGYSDTGDIVSELSSPFDPSGPPRPVVEAAVGTRSGQTVGLPGSPNAYVDLDSGWVGNAARITVYNLWDQRNWAVNGTFNRGSGHSSQPWSYYEYDPNNYDDGQWTSTLPQAGKNVTYAGLPNGAGGFYRPYARGEYSAWNSTIYVPRGAVISAQLNFTYYPDFISSFDRYEFYFYVKIEGKWAWTANFIDIKDAGNIGKWLKVSKDVTNSLNGTSIFNLPTDQYVTVSLGVYYASGAASYNWPATNNRAYFDNVSLVLQAYSLPHQITLKVKPQGGSNATFTDSGSWGAGVARLTGFTTSGTSFPFIFSAGNSTGLKSAGLTTSIAINATKQNTATSTFESHGSGQKVTWLFLFYTSLYQPSQPIGTGPTIYTKYYFNISAPNNWNYTTCTDPSGNPHDTVTDPSFMTNIVGSNKILTVNVTRIGSYSTGGNFYRINALSANYVSKVFTQKLVDESWVNSTWFLIGDTMKIVGFISSPLGQPANSGNANMTSWWGTPASLWTSNNSNIVPVNGFTNFTIHITNYRGFASNYTAEVDWVNQTLGAPQVGAGTTSFRILRDLRITAHAPSDSDQFAQNQPLKLSVQIVDDLNSTLITDLSGATPYFSVNWTGTWPVYLKWNSLGGNWTIDPSNPVMIPLTAHGAYLINVTITGPYYTNVTHTIDIYVIYGTSAQIVGGNFKQTEWGPKLYNFSVYYFGLSPPVALSGAFVSCKTTDPVNWVSRFVYQGPGAAGYYDCSLDLTNVNESQYLIDLSVFGLAGYQTQDAYLTLQINSIATSPLDSYVRRDGEDVVSSSISVDSGGTAIFLFRYYSHGTGVTGANLTYTASFGSGSLTPVNGRPGYYWLNISTSSIPLNTYSVSVTAQKAHYDPQSAEVSIQITAPGLPVWLLIGGSVGSAAAVVGIFGGIWYIRRARIPFIIKKIDESLKLISKGEHEGAKPIALRSREELIVGITNERISAFGRRPIGAEAAEEGAAEAAAAAPTREESALRTELAAVETKEKPGEVIEEVEMDTLDSELQRLERFEEKEKLPDGAKEVRDVIEKYKAGKKKKKE